MRRAVRQANSIGWAAPVPESRREHMTRYALLILPSANRVYTEAATSLAAAELAVFSDSVLSGAASAAEVTRRGGVPYLEFDAGQLRPEDCAFLANISSLYALFEVTGVLLSPVELTRLDHYDDDLIHPEIPGQDERAVHQAAAECDAAGVGVRAGHGEPEADRSRPAVRAGNDPEPGTHVRLRRGCHRRGQ